MEHERRGLCVCRFLLWRAPRGGTGGGQRAGIYLSLIHIWPSGAGKSSVAKICARELRAIYLDTGAMYRALGLKAKKLSLIHI